MRNQEENMTPKILLTANLNSLSYVDAVKSCGSSADAVYNPTIDMTDYDGLILCGGNDINPAYYGENINGSVDIDDLRDKCEIALAKEYIKMQKPVFGICRGHQLINILFGGTLIQHIQNAAIHRAPEGQLHNYHSVRKVKNSLLSDLYGKEFVVNSSHHQAVKKLGDGLETVLEATDEYKTVEALVHKTLPVFSVQWHPERMCGLYEKEGVADGRRVFEYFVKMCKS